MIELLIFLGLVLATVGIFAWAMIQAAARPTPKPTNFQNFGAE